MGGAAAGDPRTTARAHARCSTRRALSVRVRAQRSTLVLLR